MASVPADRYASKPSTATHTRHAHACCRHAAMSFIFDMLPHAPTLPQII